MGLHIQRQEWDFPFTEREGGGRGGRTTAWADVAQRTVLVNSVLLELKHVHFSSADVLSLGVTAGIMWASESKTLTFWPLQKKFADTRYGKS